MNKTKAFRMKSVHTLYLLLTLLVEKLIGIVDDWSHGLIDFFIGDWIEYIR